MEVYTASMDQFSNISDRSRLEFNKVIPSHEPIKEYKK
jgi:hypothetical protein